jgi:hypothetical protein
MSDGDWLIPFVSGEDQLPAVTAEALRERLAQLPFGLQDGKDWDWLAMLVRRSLALSVPEIRDGPERDSNTDIRDEMLRLSGMAGETWLRLFDCADSVDSRLYWFALSRWDGTGGEDVGNGMFRGDPAEFVRFRAALAELDWVSSFLRDAARSLPKQAGPWRESERRRLRIARAQYLAPIFEAAFGHRATANNYPHDPRHSRATPFMVFYDEVVTLAFGPREATNYTDVVKAALLLHKRAPCELNPEFFPGLGGAE